MSNEPKPEALAYRMVATALAMKSQYQNAGLVVAREYCKAHGLDVYAIAAALMDAGTPAGKSGQIDAFKAAEELGK